MQNSNHWPAFVLPWNDTTPGPTDMSFLLDKPAGADGFIRIENGRLVTGAGKRWRIWGQNLTFGAALPPMDMAPVIAGRIAKFGINCIRLHHIDHHWPRGILKRSPYPESDRKERTTRALDPEAMARLDWFITCCREKGVYIDLNLNVSRCFSEADGVKQAEWIGYGKGLTYFDPQLIALQKEYAAQLLEHMNPFTGNRYAEEPTVALIELVNENSVIEAWVRDYLRGEQTQPFGTWGDIPDAYAADLDRLWNEWLAQQYPDRAALAQSWEGNLEPTEDPMGRTVKRLHKEHFEAMSRRRFADQASFYAELESKYFREMTTFLRSQLGVQQPIVGTAHDVGALLQLQNTAELGITDAHCYWQHPHYHPGGNRACDWSITNTPMVDDPDHSAVATLSRGKVEGLPFICSEINAPFPNDYAAEFIPIMAAYGLLQDWDGIFFYGYGNPAAAEDWKTPVITSFFSMANDPVKMAETAAGALVFLRGDVAAAHEMVTRHYTAEQTRDSIRTDPRDDKHPYSFPDLLGRLGLVHRTAVADFAAKSLRLVPEDWSMQEGEIISDTGELRWIEKPGDGHLLIDTPRHQAIVGRAGKRVTSHLTLDLSTPFAAVTLVSLDDNPIANAERLLLITAARVANTDMEWTDESRQTLRDHFGHAPTRIEPVEATLALRGLNASGALLHPLDGSGQPTGGEPMPFASADGELQITLTGNPPTVWYLIEVQR